MTRRRIAILALGLAGAGLPAVALSAPAQAAVLVSHVSSPVDGSHYLVTDDQPVTSVIVTGTSSGAARDLLDLRCYTSPVEYATVQHNVPVAADGSFATLMNTSRPFGTCILRAVPAGLPGGSNLSNFTGPQLTGEMVRSLRVGGTGPNAGKVFDYEVRFQGARAFNQYFSATNGGVFASRLQYEDGTSSTYLWGENGSLFDQGLGADRVPVRVDGKVGFGPRTAGLAYPDSLDAPGLPGLTFEATRDPVTGDTTIHEQDPIVVCPTETYPPTPASCPRFDPAGVQLDRTITTTDGGRQILISDTWRSTDGRAHTVAAQYAQTILAADNTPPVSSTPVGLNLPWLGGGYRTFTTDTTFPGPATTPASVFVRDHNTVADGDRRFPRGAISLDPAPHTVRWDTNKHVVLNYDAITVPAGGGTQVRQAFVIGTTEAEIAAKAAAQRDQINPYRPDALIRRHHTSRFAGDQVYNTSGAQQTAKGHTKRRHHTVTFDVQVQNDGTTTDTLLLQGHRPGRGFTVHYYAGTHGRTNITTAVRRGSYQLTDLAPGQAATLRIVVKTKPRTRVRATTTVLLTTLSAADHTRIDTIKAKVRVAR